MAVKDGLPATDFSRMNREYIKAVAESGSGGDVGLVVNIEATAEAAALDKTWKEISDATNAKRPVRFYDTFEEDGVIMKTAYTYYTCSHSSDPSDPLFGITVYMSNNKSDFRAATENDYPVMYRNP